MVPVKLESLIDKYCMGVNPSDDQMDEIMDLVSALGADPAEVSTYMREKISGPTKEELDKAERERKAREKAEAEKKARAEAAKKEKAEAAKKAKAEEDRKRREEEEKRAIERREAARKQERKEKRLNILATILAWLVFVVRLGIGCLAIYFHGDIDDFSKVTWVIVILEWTLYFAVTGIFSIVIGAKGIKEESIFYLSALLVPVLCVFGIIPICWWSMSIKLAITICGFGSFVIHEL